MHELGFHILFYSKTVINPPKSLFYFVFLCPLKEEKQKKNLPSSQNRLNLNCYVPLHSGATGRWSGFVCTA